MIEYPGIKLNQLIEDSNQLWRTPDLWAGLGEPAIVHKALSQIIAIVPEDSVQYVNLSFPSNVEANFLLHVFAQDLLLSVTSDGDGSGTVHTKITPRAHLSKLRLIDAPVTTDSSQGYGIPLTLELEYPDESLTLTTRGVFDPAQRDKLHPLLQTLIADLSATG